MNTLHLTNEQLNLVQTALDFYSRIGIGQFDQIKDHPTFRKHLEKHCRPKKEPEVGDRTPQGEILEIKDGKALINGSVKDGSGRWNSEQEWKPLEEVTLSTDYSRYHKIRDNADACLIQPRNMLITDPLMSRHASWGIHHPSVDDSCRIAFDIIQVIRHEKWKRNENRSDSTVDSHIHFTHRKDNSSQQIKCEMALPIVKQIKRHNDHNEINF
jgi:hypothetical protein